MKRETFWQFFTADGVLIGTFPPHFLVTPLAFYLLMSSHAYAWQSPFMRN